MSLLETYRQEIRAKIPQPLDRDEWRFTRYGLLTSVREMTNSPMSIIGADLKQKAQNSEGTALDVEVYKLGGDTVEVKSTRSCIIGDLTNTTKKVRVVWQTLVADIHMQKAEYAKNDVSYLEDLNRKIIRVENAFGMALEQIIDTTLNAKSSAVYNSPLVGDEYPLGGGALLVAKTKQPTFFNDLDAIMQGDDFYGQYKVVGNTSLLPSVRHYINQGGGNSENLQYQFGTFDYRFSNHLSQGGNAKATGYVMPDGTIGLLTRLPIDALQGNKTTRGTEWSTTFFESIGQEVGVQYYSECADLSGIEGLEHLEASTVERWQFSVDVAILTPYNSDADTLAGAIKKFEFVDVAEPGDIDPVITASVDEILDLDYTGAGPSAPQAFIVQGNFLDDDVTVGLDAGTDFEISLSPTTGFTSTDLTISAVNGAVAPTVVYVRLKAGVTGVKTDEIKISTDGDVLVTIDLKGTQS